MAIEVPETNLPNREEMRSILKTGKGLDGKPVHKDDIKNLRNARLVDLHRLAAEVNKANLELKKYIDDVQQQRDFTLGALLSFLAKKNIVNVMDYMEFCKEAVEELKKQQEKQQETKPETKEEAQKEEPVKEEPKSNVIQFKPKDNA